MRVFNGTTGQFEDRPDAGQQTGGQAFSGTQPAPSAPTSPAPDSSAMTSIGVPDSTLRNIFFQMGMANPKSINSLKDLYGFVAPKGLTAAEQKAQKAQEDKLKAQQLTQNSIGNLLTQYNNLSDLEKQPGIGKLVSLNPFSQAYTYNQQREGLYAALKDVAGAGAGSGVRINNYDINLWAKLLPEPGDTQAQVKTKIKSLDQQIKGKFGTGLDPEYLQQFGVTPSKSGSSNPGYQITNVQ